MFIFFPNICKCKWFMTVVFNVKAEFRISLIGLFFTLLLEQNTVCYFWLCTCNLTAAFFKTSPRAEIESRADTCWQQWLFSKMSFKLRSNMNVQILDKETVDTDDEARGLYLKRSVVKTSQVKRLPTYASRNTSDWLNLK